MQVALSSPMTIAGRAVAAIELRPPGRKAFDAMRTARGPVRFSDASTIRFAARLSAHSEGTIRRLSHQDLDAVGRAIEEVYVRAKHRFAVRSVLAEGANATRIAKLEADA